MSQNTIVLKFGSSILPTEDSLPQAVAEIRRQLAKGRRVIAVVSAFAGVTDALLAKAATFENQQSHFHDPSSVAALVATGEATSVAFLTLALFQAGIPASALDAGAISLRTEGRADDASPESIDTHAINRSLVDRPVLVVPGFVGRDALGRATLLGRGGSDLSALFIAAKLWAQCILFKDVNGVYDRDPATDPARARRFACVSYDSVLALPESIVQHKAVRFARDAHLHFTIAALGHDHGTLVHDGDDQFADASQRASNSRPRSAVAQKGLLCP